LASQIILCTFIIEVFISVFVFVEDQR